MLLSLPPAEANTSAAQHARTAAATSQGNKSPAERVLLLTDGRGRVFITTVADVQQLQQQAATAQQREGPPAPPATTAPAGAPQPAAACEQPRQSSSGHGNVAPPATAAAATQQHAQGLHSLLAAIDKTEHAAEGALASMKRPFGSPTHTAASQLSKRPRLEPSPGPSSSPQHATAATSAGPQHYPAILNRPSLPSPTAEHLPSEFWRYPPTQHQPVPHQPADWRIAAAGDRLPLWGPPSSDDESACSARTFARSSTSHASSHHLPMLQHTSDSSVGLQGAGETVYVKVVRAPDGTLLLPANTAIVPDKSHPALAHMHTSSPLSVQPPPAAALPPDVMHTSGAPLAGPLHVPAGMLVPTPLGYQLHPAHPSPHTAQAALGDPRASLQQIAAAPGPQVAHNPWTDRDVFVQAALQEIMEVMLHKPRGRPVKYIDLGVNRMALKYHVGVKINGRVESMGATDSELAAHMLLDMTKIGLGLYTEAAMAAPPSMGVHPEEQCTVHLAHSPALYTTQYVQRVVAQLINRNLVGTSELLHAYTRAHAAGCRPAPCLMSVAAALGGTPGQYARR